MGTWSASTFDNDHALDLLEALAEASADDRAAQVQQILDGWGAFVKRYELGLAPRVQTQAERAASLCNFEGGIRSSNPHADAKWIESLVETMRADNEALIVDDGVEEMQALLTIAELMAISRAQSKVKLPARYRTLKGQDFEQKFLHGVRDALGSLLNNRLLREIFDSMIIENVTRLARQLEGGV